MHGFAADSVPDASPPRKSWIDSVTCMTGGATPRGASTRAGPSWGCPGKRALRLVVEVAVQFLRRVLPCLLFLAAIVSLAAPASATSLMRRGIESLTRDNEKVVQASVLEIHSYWNAGHTLIFTDVRDRPSKSFKGEATEDLSFTVMGGTVGTTTTLIVGGPDL